MQCAAHPKTETNLSCGKCGTPICPKCLVHTPVGTRCRACAQLKRLPTFQVSARHYIIGAVVGLGFAVGTGVGWYVLETELPFVFFITFLLPYLRMAAIVGIGFLTGELMSLAVNRKRSTGLAVIGGLSVFLSFAVSGALLRFYFGGLWSLAAVGFGIYIAVMRLR
ncbi:MAG: B-box zinc finger protein [Dehalococcoidia bacterium]|nr:B-box zinc finger protein [Dehalococcoidia bacterium]